jgi:uncharacterized protein DUF1598
MFVSAPTVARTLRRASLALAAFASVVALSTVAEAQFFSNTRGVGGVSIDPAGMLRNATVIQRDQLRQEILDDLAAVPTGLGKAVETRKVSLRKLEAAIKECARTGKPLPDEIQFLAGLQHVRYVLVYPEKNDIVLVGPGEGWRIDGHGAVVGVTTGRPVLMLDDLLVAFRAVTNPEPSVISCSIDPSQEGMKRYQQISRRIRAGMNPLQVKAATLQALGPQEISVGGVPDTSHFARVMVAADYRMKRMGMGFEPAPVAGIPSFMQMLRSSSRKRPAKAMPRWWMEPDYKPLLRDADGLAWEIPSANVKTLTENDFYDSAGVRHETGKSDALSQKWAANMTERYDELAAADPVFAELQNCMDLAVVAALVVHKDLTARAECDLPMLIGEYQTARFPAPKFVATEAGVMKIRQASLIAYGGVQINPWAVIDNNRQSDAIAAIRDKLAVADDSSWWSN